jgi:acetyl-CoA carboxylase biotin carboxyl carrier protein
MDIAELKKLVKLMNENDLVELEIEEQGSIVRLKKAGGSGPIVALPAGQAPLMAAHVAVPTPAAPAAAAAPVAPSGPPPGTEEIRSPIVGTFYRSASPENPSYVSVGDRVKPDTVVCIVEAMKVMNEIKAERSGEVVEVLVENGQAVEFDQPLFRVKVE